MATSLFDCIAITAGLVCFAFIAWQRIEYGIYAVVALLPTYLIRFTVAGIPTTFLEAMLILLFIEWLAHDKKWQRINIHWWKKEGSFNVIPAQYRLPLALLLVSSFIAAILSPSQPHAFGIFKAYFIEPIAFLLVFTYELKEQKQLERVLQILGGLTVVIGSVALWQYATGFGIPNPFWADALTRRSTTFFGYPNASSLFVGPVIGLYLGYLFKRDELLLQTFKVMVIFFGVMTIVTAKTAGAGIAVAIALWFVIAFKYKKFRPILSGMTALLLIFFLFLPSTQEKLTHLSQNVSRNYLDLSSSSLEIRINQWRETVTYLYHHPIRGTGIANYQDALRPYHTYAFLEVYLYPHNLFLNFWTELGALGLIACLMLGWQLIRTLRMVFTEYFISGNSFALGIGTTLAWIIVVVHGLVDVPYFKNDLSVLTMILVGFTIYIDTKIRVLSQHREKSW